MTSAKCSFYDRYISCFGVSDCSIIKLFFALGEKFPYLFPFTFNLFPPERR